MDAARLAIRNANGDARRQAAIALAIDREFADSTRHILRANRGGEAAPASPPFGLPHRIVAARCPWRPTRPPGRSAREVRKTVGGPASGQLRRPARKRNYAAHET
jgi:hypothetical protein